MTPVTSLLASTLLFASLALAAPMQNEVAVATGKKAATISTVRGDNRKSKRARPAKLVAGVRRKREIIVAEEPQDDSMDQHLAELSDDQVALLADIVQQKLDQYDPSLPLQSYRMVELPEEFQNLGLDLGQEQEFEEEDPMFEEEIILPSRARRSEQNFEEQPMIVIPEEQLQDMIDEEEQVEEQPQIVFVPEEALEERADYQQVAPLNEQLLDELELRSRISELANILNERASRRL